ncbi:hypothetical protein CERZMDRAFT_115204 [Cercospora zeae-maydis SCOH1-5]|uniref:Glutamine amidotransferase type-2 domain-containing protein n=1 Tax=Cercospora zeae-maydis SCOH1-5 TaxID=717836 RepID=A0A6A6F0T4_9PEZI|nr:hypothetical protein CERZMDRAFT_115204 [Cercospora zeae-maydis SCOH1-5]
MAYTGGGVVEAAATLAPWRERLDQVRHSKSTEKDRDKLNSQLDASVESMRHRGPDAKGIWISKDCNVGLAHVRLSTRDLSQAGHQPLHSSRAEDDIHIVVNGELYFDDDLLAGLAKVYKFQSSSDSEVPIALYLKSGLDFVHYLRGEFSLVLFDGKLRRFLVVRDRFGVKPLHYGEFGGKLFVSTQCKGIAALARDEKQLDWDVLCMSQGGGHYGNRSLFDGIRKVPAGHMLVAYQGAPQSVEFTPYWELQYPADGGHSDNRTEEELVLELRERLIEAVRLRLVSSDVPVGLLLSGGVDSSAVAGIAAHLSQQQGKSPDRLPTCFTIAFPDDSDLDESAVAVRTAKHIGLPIEKIIVDEQVLADQFEESCWLGEALMWDLQHIAKKAMSKHIRSRGLKVVLNGDGSDELFGGYSFFVDSRLQAEDRRRAPNMKQPDSADDLEHVREKKADASRCIPAPFCNMAVLDPADWLLPELRSMSSPLTAVSKTFTENEAANMKELHPLHRSMAAWNKTILPNMVIAAISDGAEMSHSIESRPPFLDHVLSEWAQKLPVDVLVHVEEDGGVTEKWLFREAVRPFVTEEVYQRRKHPFSAPFWWQPGGPLQKKLASLITEENVARLGFVEWDRCKDLVDKVFYEKDEGTFRSAIWLAQIISIGSQFDVRTWQRPDDDISLEMGTNGEQKNGDGSG